MNTSEMTKQLNKTHKELTELIRSEKDLIQQLCELASQYNTLVNTFVDEAKSRARETQETVKVGPVVARPTITEKWDLDAAEHLLSDAEFRSAVEIEYKLKPKGIGAGILTALTIKYPQLDDLKRKEVKAVYPSGLKPVSIEDLILLAEGNE